MMRGSHAVCLALGVLLASCTPETAPVRRVLLVTIDTLRWDRLGYAGYDVETPNLDRLARSGTYFTEAVSVAPLTLPSHSSLFTGLYPPKHGVRANGVFQLDDRVETVAEALQRAGFATGAFVGAFVLDRRFGLTQGFDHYDDELPEQNPVNRVYYPERPADEVVERALRWIRERGEEPFFAWVHVFDPHAPYAPPPPFDERYADRPYAGEIAWTDRALGPLLDSVASMDDSLVVVTSDHGESLGEHGESTHGLYVYDSTIRVPLILSGAGVPEGGRVDALVRGVDVAPTVLAMAGLELAGGIDGESLLPLMRSGEGAGREAYAESFLPRFSFNWSELRALRTDGFKYIEAPRPELYDLRADPMEGNNLWSELEPAPARGRELARELASVLEGEQRLQQQVELDPETARRLESLGYVASAAPGSSEDRPRPDPKDRIEVYERMHALLSPELSADEIVAGYEALLELEPTNALARNRLANALSEQGRLEEAIVHYRRLVRDSEIDFNGLENLSAALLLEGRTEEALATTEMAVAAAPWNPDFHVLRGEALEQADRIDEALLAYDEAVALEPAAENLWRRGAVAERLGRLARAESDFRNALASDGRFAPARVALARLLAGSGRAQEAYELLDGAETDSVELRTARAEAHLASGRFGEAKKLLEQARREVPDNTRVLALLGPLYGREGKLELATDVLEEAISLGETAPDLRRNLAVVYLRRGRVRPAVEQLELASARAPEDPSIWFSLGNALVQARDASRAVEAFERALALRAPWPEAAFNLAVAAEQAGDVGKATGAYRLYLETSDASDTGRRREALRRLRRLEGDG